VEGANRQEIFHDDEDLKAKMVKLKRVDEWRWSSCRPYYGIENQFRKLLDPSLILGMFSEDHILARERFKEFSLEKRPEITGMVLVVKIMRTVPVSLCLYIITGFQLYLAVSLFFYIDQVRIMQRKCDHYGCSITWDTFYIKLSVHGLDCF
jgi:hypothetical protein